MQLWKNLRAKVLDKNILKYTDEIKDAILIRCVENKLLQLYKNGKLNGTVHTCVGQELVGVFISKYLLDGDHIVSNHRGHGHYLSRFRDIKGLIGEILGKTEGCAGGIGGSQHLVNKNYISNGIQGGMVPIAAGIGLYFKYEQSNNISVAYIGDGTMGSGLIYESFNIASKWELPVLIVMENNRYAQSTSMRQTFSGDIKGRIEGFGLKYFRSDTNKITDLDITSKNAINYVRKNQKPVFIEVSTNRLNAHSKGDDNRSEEELKGYRDNDILINILNDGNSIFTDYKKQVDEEIDKIIKKLLAKESKKDVVPDILKDINEKVDGLSPEIIEEKGRYNHLINKSLKSFLRENPKAIIIGEDIEDENKFTPKGYGGAFKVTSGLSREFKKRVLNTPISESAITGIISGYCIKGGRSFVEIMFGDFTTLIFDQLLQHCSKFELMYNRKISCPVTIRTPMGGKRGYGPTHSQSIEKHFLGIPNLGVIALNHRISPEYIYSSLKENKSTPFLI